MIRRSVRNACFRTARTSCTGNQQTNTQARTNNSQKDELRQKQFQLKEQLILREMYHNRQTNQQSKLAILKIDNEYIIQRRDELKKEEMAIRQETEQAHQKLVEQHRKVRHIREQQIGIRSILDNLRRSCKQNLALQETQKERLSLLSRQNQKLQQDIYTAITDSARIEPRVQQVSESVRKQATKIQTLHTMLAAFNRRKSEVNAYTQQLIKKKKDDDALILQSISKIARSKDQLLKLNLENEGIERSNMELYRGNKSFVTDLQNSEKLLDTLQNSNAAMKKQLSSIPSVKSSSFSHTDK